MVLSNDRTCVEWQINLENLSRGNHFVLSFMCLDMHINQLKFEMLFDVFDDDNDAIKTDIV
jgi:hypothetical protein